MGMCSLGFLVSCDCFGLVSILRAVIFHSLHFLTMNICMDSHSTNHDTSSAQPNPPPRVRGSNKPLNISLIYPSQTSGVFDQTLHLSNLLFIPTRLTCWLCRRVDWAVISPLTLSNYLDIFFTTLTIHHLMALAFTLKIHSL